MDEKFNVVYEYTDEQAVEDGVLVPVGQLKSNLNGVTIDRLTINFYSWLTGLINPLENNGEEYFDPETIRYYLAQLNGYIEKSDDFMIVINPVFLSQKDNQSYTRKAWAMKNERNNYTVMFPEDY